MDHLGKLSGAEANSEGGNYLVMRSKILKDEDQEGDRAVA